MDGKKKLRRSPRLSSTALHGLEADSETSDNPKGPAMSGFPTNRYLYSQTVLGSHSTESTLTGSSQGLTNPSEKGQTSDSEVFTRMSYLAMENSRHIAPANESRPSRKSVLRIILNIPCLLLMAFVSLPRYLVKACISSVELITLQNVKMIFKILLLLIPIISAGFYCFDWFSSWRLREEEMSQLHGAEMKSYWKSYVLLKEQFNEIENLKKEMDLLRAELDNVKNGILHSVKQILEENGIPVDNKDRMLEMIKSQLKKIYEDDVQMPDWAQKTIGATIDASRTSKSYELRNEDDSWFTLLFLSFANPPDTILQPDVSPGSCWAFPGSQGQVVIKLPEKIQPTAVTIQHISKAISPSGEVTSAPKDFAVYGLDEKTETEILLGKFMYDLEKELIQTFQLQMELPASFSYIKFSVLSNWGHSDYTCIYRVRVHGKMVNKS